MSLEFTRRALSIPFYPAAETYKFEGVLVKQGAVDCCAWRVERDAVGAERSGARGG